MGEPISLITIDKKYGLVLAGVHNVIRSVSIVIMSVCPHMHELFVYRVYNTGLELLQVCRGHEDSVRAILHIPEDDQVHGCACIKQHTYQHWDISQC